MVFVYAFENLMIYSDVYHLPNYHTSVESSYVESVRDHEISESDTRSYQPTEDRPV